MREMTTEQFYRSLTIAKFRVKIRSLAQEAKIIRHVATKRNNHRISDSLRSHNVNVVRPEQRHTLLAYAFYRGVPYSLVERCSKANKPSAWRIARVLKSLTYLDHLADVKLWLASASANRKTA